MGHDVMANALAHSLAARGWSSETLDAMALLGGPGHRAGEAVFRALLATPGGFDAVHFAALRSGTSLADFMDRQAAKRIAPRLERHLVEHPAELTVSVFATAAAAASRAKARGVRTKTVTFCTDVNPHRLWVHPHTDVYLVTSETSEAFVRRFEPEAKVIVVPAPVRPSFYQAPSREQARQALGIEREARVAMLMAGAWGLGPLADVAASLAKADVHTIAVAGRNEALEQRLRAAASRDARIHPFGFTDRVPELMAASDLVVTSAGDTCSEARVIGRRMVLLDVVAGHGRENLQHELELGNALVASTQPGLLVRAVLRGLAHGRDPAPQDRRDGWERGLGELLATFALD
jgi:UDP-N-acetylglucosamine:LPS N-acetylglucosamine transferase